MVSLASLAALAILATLAGCASPPPVERYTPPPPEAPGAEVELRLMMASRNRSAALYVQGAVKCNPSALAARLVRTVEEPARFVAGSWENRFNPVVRLPAGEPVPLRFRYLGPGEEYRVEFVVVLEPGRRYVFDHEIPGRRVTLVDSASGLPPLLLPPRMFHDALACPR
jgi:hypothetical protein